MNIDAQENGYSLLIIGAGVDKTKGIDFPLANRLLSKIAVFCESDEDGSKFSSIIRSFLPKLQFGFSKLITQSINKITNKEIGQQKKLIEKISQATKEYNINSKDDNEKRMHKLGELLIKLFEKWYAISEAAILDDDIKQLINEIFKDKANDYLDSDEVIDIDKMSLSETFKSVLKYTLNESLQENDNKIAEVLCSEMLNIEDLLIEKFIGFYTNKTSDIKNYVYISWMLWAYLATQEKKVLEKYGNKSIPFYSNIPRSYKAITLNYTSFLERQLGKGNVVYFHGGLSSAIHMDQRSLTTIENYECLDIADFFNNDVKPNINIDDSDIRDSKVMIPALIPPLKIKPVLSTSYIEEWHKSIKWIHNANKIVIIGYSFNYADEHFNDIIRSNKNGKNIYIIAPDILSDNSLKNMHNIFSISPNDWRVKTLMNKNSKYKDNIFFNSSQSR